MSRVVARAHGRPRVVLVLAGLVHEAAPSLHASLGTGLSTSGHLPVYQPEYQWAPSRVPA
eukprot:362867-Chlamydomonas_euryale.AAC.4